MKKMIAALLAGAFLLTSAPAPAENANADSTAEVSYTELYDVPEDSENYTAIRWCVDNGYETLDADGSFRPDDPAAFGDLICTFYQMLRGENDPDAAIAYLANYGIVPVLPAETEMTREEMVHYTVSFCSGVGLYEAGCRLKTYADTVTEGYEEAWAFCLKYGLIAADENNCLRPQETATRADAARLLYMEFGR